MNEVIIEGLKPVGHKFYKMDSEAVYLSACSSCGTVRKKGKTDYSYGSEHFCPNCGRSFRGESARIIKPIYVIGHFKQWDGKLGYMLSYTNPNKIEEASHNGKGWSYWSYTTDRLGTDFYASRKQLQEANERGSLNE